MSIRKTVAAVSIAGIAAYAGSAAEVGEPAPAPEFTGVTEWVNTKPLKLTDQNGKVVAVHFWTNQRLR